MGKASIVRTALGALAGTALLALSTSLPQAQAQQAQTGAAANQQQPAPAKPAPQPWVVSCQAPAGQPQFICVMSQTLRARGNNLRLLSASIEKAANSPQARLRLALPHGVLLTQGTEIWVDKGQKKPIPISQADANGSYAVAPVDDDLLASLKRGAVLNTAFSTANGQRIEMQLSLNGFTAAFSKL